MKPKIKPKDIKKIIKLGLKSKDKIYNGMCKVKNYRWI